MPDAALCTDAALSADAPEANAMTLPAKLTGFSVGVTADSRAGAQVSLLEGRGAQCVHGATVQTDLNIDEGQAQAVTAAFIAEPPDVLVVTTDTGLRGWLELAEAFQMGDGLLDAMSRVRIVARGPRAHGALVAAGLEPDWVAASMSAEVASHLASTSGPGSRIVIQVGGASAHPLVAELSALGAIVTTISPYRCPIPTDRTAAEALVRSVADHRLDAVTFTSRAAVDNFVQIARELDLFDEVGRAFEHNTIACAIAAVCAEGLSCFGDPCVVVPEKSRLGAMVAALGQELLARSRTVLIGGVRVDIRGRQVVVGDADPVLLSMRERQLLDALITKPGVVRSKKQLLCEVWGSEESNFHVVEVTIGRLRRRLGEAGIGIETVIQRGYRTSAH